MTDDIHNIRIGDVGPRSSATPVRIRADSGNSSGGAPGPAMVNGGNGNYFEALRDSKDRTPIPQATVHMRSHFQRILQGQNRKMLACIGRYLVDNGGVPAYAVDQIANYSVPIFPQASTDDPGANTEYENFFYDWSKRADYTRRFTFQDLQRIACRSIDTDGDIGANMDAKRGFPQLKLFTTFRIGDLVGFDPTEGVIRDEEDVVQGYKVIEGSDLITGKANRIIPSDQFILLRDIDRYENFRGFPGMRTGTNDIRDRSDIKAFAKLKEKLAAALGGVIQNKGLVDEDVWGDDTGNAPDADAPASEQKLSLAELLGGDIVTIDGELKMIEGKTSGVQTIQFLDFLAGEFVFGLGIPPAFFLDEKLTGPNVRAVLGKIQRKFDNRKEMIARLVEFCWLRVIGWGIDTKQLRAVPKWDRIGFQYQPLMTIDLGDQMANEREDVATGQMSRQERWGNRGKDWQRGEDQITREDDYVLDQCIKQAKKHGVPLETILAKRGFGNTRPPVENKFGANSDEGNDKKKEEKKK